MPREPLKETTLFKGKIYLKGETGYGEDLAQSLAEKAAVPIQSDNVFFVAPDEEEKQNKVASEPVVSVEPEPPVAPTTVRPFQIAEGGEQFALPEDFPNIKLFIDSGYTTVNDVMKLTSLTDVDGIGEAKAREVNEWIMANVVLV